MRHPSTSAEISLCVHIKPQCLLQHHRLNNMNPPHKQKRVFSLLIRPFDCNDTMCCYRMTQPTVGSRPYTCRRISLTIPSCITHDQRLKMNPFSINSCPPCPVKVLYLYKAPLTVYLYKYILYIIII